MSSIGLMSLTALSREELCTQKVVLGSGLCQCSNYKSCSQLAPIAVAQCDLREWIDTLSHSTKYLLMTDFKRKFCLSKISHALRVLNHDPRHHDQKESKSCW